MKTAIQNGLDVTANLCLLESQHNDYSDTDLMNATLIFSHVLLDTTYSASKELSSTERLELAKLTGEAIRNLIFSATGKDMHVVAKHLTV